MLQHCNFYFDPQSVIQHLKWPRSNFPIHQIEERGKFTWRVWSHAWIQPHLGVWSVFPEESSRLWLDQFAWSAVIVIIVIAAIVITIVIITVMYHQLMVIGPICLIRWALLFVATSSLFFSSSLADSPFFSFSSFSSSSPATSLVLTGTSSSVSSAPPMAGGARSWLASETSIPVSPASALSYLIFDNCLERTNLFLPELLVGLHVVLPGFLLLMLSF